MPDEGPRNPIGRFEDRVTKNFPMSGQEAAALFAAQWGWTEDLVLSRLHLQREGKVMFEDSIASGYPCLALVYLDADGKRAGS